MPSCVVKWCKSHTDMKNSGITFHKFPTNKIQRNKWIAAVRLERNETNWTPCKTSTICSIHFQKEAMYVLESGSRVRLKKSALPICTMVTPLNVHSNDFLGPLSTTCITNLQKESSVTISDKIERKLHSPSCCNIEQKKRKLEETTSKEKEVNICNKMHEKINKEHDFEEPGCSYTEETKIKMSSDPSASTAGGDAVNRSLKRPSKKDGETITVVCTKCNAEVEHPAEKIIMEQRDALISKVYHYLDKEYEELKSIYSYVDLSPLSALYERTAMATGVNVATVKLVLKDGSASKVSGRKNKRRKLKILFQDSDSDEDSLCSDHGDETADTQQDTQMEIDSNALAREKPHQEDNIANNTKEIGSKAPAKKKPHQEDIANTNTVQSHISVDMQEQSKAVASISIIQSGELETFVFHTDLEGESNTAIDPIALHVKSEPPDNDDNNASILEIHETGGNIIVKEVNPRSEPTSTQIPMLAETEIKSENIEDNEEDR